MPPEQAAGEAAAPPHAVPFAGLLSDSRGLGHRLRRSFSPLRLVAVGIISIIVVTGWWLVRQRAVDTAERELRAHSASGLTAFADGEFAAARQDLAVAVDAAQKLARNDVKSRLLRQRLLEATAADDLVSMTLFEIVKRAAAVLAQSTSPPEELLESRIAGKWFVMDTTVHRMESDAGNRGFAIDYPLIVAGVPVYFAGNIEQLDRLQAEHSPQRIVFAAQLRSLRRTNTAWVVELRPDTAFLWTDRASLVRLGLAQKAPLQPSEDAPTAESADELQRLLAQQAQIAEVAE